MQPWAPALQPFAMPPETLVPIRKGVDLKIPTLTITGGCDPTFSHAMGEQLCAHFERSKHLHLPGAGHILMAEYPQEVNAALRDWRTEIIAWSSTLAISKDQA